MLIQRIYLLRATNSEKSDDDVGVSGRITTQPTGIENQAENCFSEKHVLEADRKESDGHCTSPTQR